MKLDSLAKKLGLLLTLIIVIFLVLFSYITYLRVKERILYNNLEQLQQYASTFEKAFSKKSKSIQQIMEDISLSHSEKIKLIDKKLYPVLKKIIKDKEIMLGYYSKQLDSVVTIAPKEKYQKYIGSSLPFEHPVRKIYMSGQGVISGIFNYNNDEKFCIYQRVIYRRGAPIGHIVSSIHLNKFYKVLIKEMGIPIVVILVMVLAGFFTIYYTINIVEQNIKKFSNKIEAFGLYPDKIEPDRNLRSKIPEEFKSLANSYNKMVNRIKELTRELNVSERLASMGDVVAIIAHEVRNPLATIKATAQMGEIIKNNDEFKKLFKIINKNCNEINKFIEETLKLAKSPTDEKIKFEISEIIEDLSVLINPLMKSYHINFIKNIQTESVITGNKVALEQVLMNLLKNAIDATPKNGQIKLSIYKINDRNIRIEIDDTGSGIPEEIQDELFKKFFTTKGEKGTGIGLAFVHRVIENHGGNIWFETRVGVGTTFFIELPNSS